MSDNDWLDLCARAGFDELTTSPCGESLYVLLHSAPGKDGRTSKAPNSYTRFLKYNVKDLNNIKLEAEYITPPQSSKGATLGRSEPLWLNHNPFLVWALDGNDAGVRIPGQNTNTYPFSLRCLIDACY